MACIGKMEVSKDDCRFWKIQVHNDHGKSPFATRFYWPTGKAGIQPAEEKQLGQAVEL